MWSDSGSLRFNSPKVFHRECVVTVYRALGKKCAPVSLSFLPAGLDVLCRGKVRAPFVIRASAASYLIEWLAKWDLALMNDLILSQRWRRLKTLRRLIDYYLMRNAIICLYLLRTKGLIFVIWKSFPPKSYPRFNADWFFSRAAVAENACRSVRIRAEDPHSIRGLLARSDGTMI